MCSLTKTKYQLLNAVGLTLTELIVATVIMGVVMVGVASVDIGIRNAFEGTTENIAVASEVSALMHHISTNVSQSTGWQGNPGIVINGSKLSIRKDTNTPQTPDDLTDDGWFIYNPGLVAFSVVYCTANASTATCLTTDPRLGGGRILSFTPTLNADNQLNVTIDGVFDPSIAVDPITNPEYLLQSTFNPSSMSGG